MKSEYTYDYIHGTDVYVYQHRKMFRINTDTALLAEFMVIKEGESVLDIGTNNGALLAVAARMNPSRLIGIELQAEAAELARYNMAHNHIEQAEIICGDVCTTDLPKVDVIVCNPPYFKVSTDSNLNESKALQLARHEKYLTLPDLCRRVSSLLDEKGRFYLVHRASRIGELAYTLHEHRLEIKTLQFIYDENKEEAITVLIEAVKDASVQTRVMAGKTLHR